MMRYLTISILLFLFAFQAIAQDVHFSHIHASPLNNNPAWVGVFNSDFRFIMNYRNQWRTATSNFNTYALSVDSRVVNLSKKATLNAGFSFIGDSGGDLNYGTNNYNFHLGTLFPLDNKGKSFLTLGTQLGFIQQHVDFSQVQALEYEPLVYSYDLRAKTFDLSAGLGYYYSVSEQKSLYMGLAMYHINQPDMSVTSSGSEIPLFKRYVLNLGANWELKNNIGIQPSLVAYWQGPHKEINMGSFVSFKVGENSFKYGEDKRFYFGAWTRYYLSNQFRSGFDALILSARYDVGGFIATFSFDLTLSKLSQANGTVGGPELSLIYMVPVKRKNFSKSKVYCPKF